MLSRLRLLLAAAAAAAAAKNKTTVPPPLRSGPRRPPPPPPIPGETVLRLDAGAASDRTSGDGGGNTAPWLADAPYVVVDADGSGSPPAVRYGSSVPGGGTTPGLFDTARWGGGGGVGALEYALPVPIPGRYAVRLHFAERFASSEGRRVFDVLAEGRPTALSDLDVLREAGGRDAPLTREVEADVSDGTLDLRLVRSRSASVAGGMGPMVSGVEVTYRGPIPPESSESSERDAAQARAQAADAAERVRGGRRVQSDYPCGCETCTSEILDTMVTDAAGTFSCGARMDYLRDVLGKSDYDACVQIAGTEFGGQCGPYCDPRKCGDLYAEPADPNDLIWSDEFDEDGKPDPARWTYNIGGSGWGNGEEQYYTDREANAFVRDGVLHIRALREEYGGKSYTSARLMTHRFGYWRYGRIQVRARLQNCLGRGTWVAIWMLPMFHIHGWWPASGEIDIMEHHWTRNIGIIHGTIHTETNNGLMQNQAGGSITVDLDDYHVYELLWDDERIAFAVDGTKYHWYIRNPDVDSYKIWPFDQNFYLILNLAVGGTLGGIFGVDRTVFDGPEGQTMEIDWVRVYSNPASREVEDQYACAA